MKSEEKPTHDRSPQLNGHLEHMQFLQFLKSHKEDELAAHTIPLKKQQHRSKSFFYLAIYLFFLQLAEQPVGGNYSSAVRDFNLPPKCRFKMTPWLVTDPLVGVS